MVCKNEMKLILGSLDGMTLIRKSDFARNEIISQSHTIETPSLKLISAVFTSLKKLNVKQPLIDMFFFNLPLAWKCID